MDMEVNSFFDFNKALNDALAHWKLVRAAAWILIVNDDGVFGSTAENRVDKAVDHVVSYLNSPIHAHLVVKWEGLYQQALESGGHFNKNGVWIYDSTS